MAETQTPELGFKRINDETIEVYVKGDYIGTMTYTELGWSGMSAAEQLLKDMAEALGVTVVEMEDEEDEDD